MIEDFPLLEKSLTFAMELRIQRLESKWLDAPLYAIDDAMYWKVLDLLFFFL